jgi:hypothetical protein
VTLHNRTSLTRWNPSPAGLAGQTPTCIIGVWQRSQLQAVQMNVGGLLDTPTPGQNPRYSPEGRLAGPQSRSLRFLDGDIFLLLQRTEPRLLGCTHPNNVRWKEKKNQLFIMLVPPSCHTFCIMSRCYVHQLLRKSLQRTFHVDSCFRASFSTYVYKYATRRNDSILVLLQDHSTCFGRSQCP